MFAKLFKPAPAPLTKVTQPTAELLPKLNASPEAQALYQPGQSPGEYLQVLEQNQKPMESVNLLAHGMPEKDAVKWASESSKMVGDKLNPADQKALGAADQWLANPTPENQAAAADAAAATNGSGPGGWTAQAAAWAQPATQGAQAAGGAGAGGGGGGGGTAAAAAAGAVMLAAGLVDKPAMPDTPRPSAAVPTATAPNAAPPETPGAPAVPPATQPETPQMKPADAAAFSKKLKPFLDLGKKIASGQA
jgi:hypothetical protein